MKTIRQNCFETNSSSTHSVTIIRKGDLKEPKNNPIVIDGVLYHYELCNSIAYRSMSYGDGGHVLSATTKDQKAALFVSHMISRVEYDFDEKTSEKIMGIVKEELIGLCGYADVKTDGNSNFSAYNEGGDCYIDKILPCDVDEDDFNESEFRAAVSNHIIEVILNEDVIIIDEDVPY